MCIRDRVENVLANDIGSSLLLVTLSALLGKPFHASLFVTLNPLVARLAANPEMLTKPSAAAYLPEEISNEQYFFVHRFQLSPRHGAPS